MFVKTLMKASLYFFPHMKWYFISVSGEQLSCVLFRHHFVLLIKMGDFQQFKQDFHQTGYYMDEQGQTVGFYNTTSPCCYDK